MKLFPISVSMTIALCRAHRCLSATVISGKKSASTVLAQFLRSRKRIAPRWLQIGIVLFAGAEVVAAPVQLLASSGALAAPPVHQHCLVIPWAIHAFVPLDPPSPVTQASFHIVAPSGIFDPTAASGETDDCKYEISDILTFQIELIFSGVDSIIEDNQNRVPTTYLSGVFADAGPALHAHGTAGASNINARHAQTYTFHFFSPDPTKQFSLESFRISASGSHYYLPVPEPGTVLLTFLAILLLAMAKPHVRGRGATHLT